MQQRFITYPVHDKLKNWVRYFWSYDGRGNENVSLHLRAFADQYPRLIFQDIRNFEPIRNGKNQKMPVCYISGLKTEPSHLYWAGCFSHFGVSFYPHALHLFFKIDAHELTDQRPDLLHIVKSNIPLLLQDTVTHEERIKILCRYFLDKIKKNTADEIVNDIFHRHSIEELGTGIKIFQLARRYKISERQLQRRFKNNMGIPARTYYRIHKFGKALRLLSKAKYGDLTRLTYNLGYFDQSHFIRDFKAFSGRSPYAFIKQNDIGGESASFIYKES